SGRQDNPPFSEFCDIAPPAPSHQLFAMPSVIDVATIQFAPRKGEYEANLARLGELFAQVDTLSPRPQVLHLPETALTGYFLEGGVREFALTAGTQAADLQRVYRNAVPQAAD